MIVLVPDRRKLLTVTRRFEISFKKPEKVFYVVEANYMTEKTR